MKQSNALIIGASSGIGAELVKQLSQSDEICEVHAVSRKKLNQTNPKVRCHQINSLDEQQIRALCKELHSVGHFRLVVSCIGVLQSQIHDKEIKPEKRLEDISADQLETYFKINTIAPMLWLKHLPLIFDNQKKSQVVMLSARVGSIADNRLGGWYGYRASKAALNMLVKNTQVEYSRRFKNVELICYHPGTVDTDLSKPFQANVPQNKLFSVSFTVDKLLNHIHTLDIQYAPHFIDWDNQPIDW
ncbi:SDR family NAD(P)-dependent oxidoreductase [Aliiglaciecola lipolytica]|uniref:Oxidoreductase, short-chain dehydrogenase/reductase family protein n=1 Tax=Aliiglaciecola lipolytica E3 TaxID=1127673 RepID=K6Z0I9_9ALTE|nr:SDR family NAD(P)-dependent oxidoreductase [Aliiglaciecola lipolytica]GAC16970.1 oxidoreductase, short-chain dehydrogenase/reductase family protein [Aliiglaciecola lipolytica E3]